MSAMAFGTLMYLVPEVLHNLHHSSTVSYSCFICNGTLAGCLSLAKEPAVWCYAFYICCNFVESIQAVNMDCMYYCTILKTFTATG
jgi:hypothetical protein